MDMTVLLEPVLKGGISNTNYYNGRPLTADDLKTEQTANRRQHQQLGRAIGDGVVYGFEITAPEGAPTGANQSRILRIEKGLAFNRLGEAVELSSMVNLELAPSTTALASDSGLFEVCGADTTTSTLENHGFYMLTARPASGPDGRSPVVEAGCNGVATGCDVRFILEGVKFRLLEITLGSGATKGSPRAETVVLLGKVDSTLVSLSSVANPTGEAQASLRRDLSLLRNHAAHMFFGTNTVPDFASDPFPHVTPGSGKPPYAQSSRVSYGMLDDLYQAKTLDPSEVPLAVVYWSRRGVEFADWWSVRRPAFPASASVAWSPIAGTRDAAEALAVFLQFQHHLDDLQSSGMALDTVRATDYFRYLPPVGLVPTSVDEFEATLFFDKLFPEHETSMDSAKLSVLIREALQYPPMDLTAAPQVQRYAIIPAGGTSARHAYEVFASRQLHGILEDDDVARVFLGTWDAYRKLLKVMLASLAPRSNSNTFSSSAGAVIAFLLARLMQGCMLIRDVMDVANRYYTLAAGRHLARIDALGAFEALYEIQHELLVILGRSSVSVSPSSATVSPGQTKQLTATVTGSTDTDVTWSSSSTSVATVNSTGLVTAVGAGTTTITATLVADPSTSASATITVRAASAVTVTPASLTLTVGQTASLVATVTGSTNTAVSWSSSSPTVASVSSSGVVTAVGAGSATITATSQANSGNSGAAIVTVTGSTGTSIGTPAPQKNLAQLLADYLDGPVGPTGIDALKPSLQQDDLAACVRAQAALNAFFASLYVGIVTGNVSSYVAGPLSGVRISLVGTTLATTSNSSGKFVISNIPPGHYQLKAEMVGRQASTKPVDIVPGEINVDFYLD